MTAFMKREVQNYRPKFYEILKKLNADWLDERANSGDHVRNDSESGDLTIFILLIVCALLFWM